VNGLLLIPWLATGLALAQPASLWTGSPAEVDLLQDGGVGMVWRVGEAQVALRPGPGDPLTRRCHNPRAHLLVLKPSEAPEVAEAVATACDRLAADPDLWASRTVRAPVRTDAPVQPRPLWALSLLWWLLVPACLPRTRAAFGWALAAFVVRWGLAPPRVLMSGDYPYQRALAALGAGGIDPQNGDGFAAIFGWIGLATGQPAHLPHALNLVLGALTAAWLYEGTQRATEDAKAAHLATALWVLQPVAVLMSTTEDMFPLVVALHAAAWASWQRGGAHRWFAALTLGLLAHTRPLQPLVVGLWCLLWLRREHWRPLTLTAVLVGWRAVELLIGAGQAGSPPTSGRFDLLTSETIWRAFTGQTSNLLVTDPSLAPWWTVPAALFGAWTLRRTHPALVRHAGLTLAVLLLTAAHQDRLTDLVRFQLPALLWWSVLGGAGIAHLLRSRPGLAPYLVLACASGLWLARQPFAPRPTWAAEHAALWAHVRALPEGAVVRYDPAWDPNGNFAAWTTRAGQATWRPITSVEPLRAGELLWLGRAARWPGAAPLNCALEPITAWRVPAEGWKIEDLGTEPILLGLHRVRSCAPNEPVRVDPPPAEAAD
jgi:hypothetical protein